MTDPDCFVKVMKNCIDTIDLAEQCFSKQISAGVDRVEADRLCERETNNIRECISVTLCKDQIKRNKDSATLWQNCGEKRWDKCVGDYSAQ